MAADSVSPEERLFNIIQNGKNAAPKKKNAPHSKAGARLFSRPHRAEPALAEALMMPAHLGTEDIGMINKILALALIITAGVVFYYSVNAKPRLSEITERISGIPFKSPQKKAIEALRPISFYLDRVKKRDILHPAPEIKGEGDFASGGMSNKEFSELTAGFKLQGISRGDSPKAMIMDEAEGQIYFLKEGEKVGATGIVIKKITKDKVMVGYGKEEMELQ